MIFHAGHEHEHGVGALIDNDIKTLVKLVTAKDRATKDGAHELFDSLYEDPRLETPTRVMVHTAWRMELARGGEKRKGECDGEGGGKRHARGT